MNTERTDYDSPWKQALEDYFEDFIALFFPQAHTGVDWTQGYEFLDKELQQVVRDAELGQRLVDKLVKVCRQDGEESWVLVHVEVQSQAEQDFARRMYTYNYRLFDRYDRQVASLAVLGDEQPGWRPQCFGYELWGSKVRFEFPVVKLLDYQQRWAELENSVNPFATVVMAHLKAQETRHDATARKYWKFTLMRRLYERGYQRTAISNLFRFIDWLLNLPEELEIAFWQELQAYEEEKRMTYITSVERIGYQRGVEDGLEQGLEQGLERGAVQATREAVSALLEVRFGALSAEIASALAQLVDLPRLKALHKQAATVTSLEDFEKLLV